MFYLMTHAAHFNLQLYGVRHTVKDYIDNERVFLRLTAREVFYAPSHRIFFF